MKTVLLIVTLLLTPSVTWAEDAADKAATPPVLSLEEAQSIALKNHPALLSAGYRLKASKQAVKEARADYFPQLSGEAVRAFADDNARVAASGGLNNPLIVDRASYGVGASQLITDFGRTNHRVDAAKAQAEAQAARSLSVRDQVLFEVTSAYFNVLRAQKIAQVAEATLQARQSLSDQVASLLEAKMKSNLDASIARQGISEARLLALQAHNQLDDAKAQLAQAMGYETTQDFVLEDNASGAEPDKDMESLLAQAKQHNPQLQSLRAELRAAQSLAKADEAANYPTVRAVGYAGENPVRDHARLDSSYAAGGITLSIPLFTGGRLEAAQKRSTYQASALEQDVLTLENSIARDVRQSWNDMQAAYSNIEVAGEMRTTSGEALELTQARYDIGKSSIVDLAQAELASTRAEIAAADAVYDYRIRRALLHYKAGIP